MYSNPLEILSNVVNLLLEQSSLPRPIDAGDPDGEPSRESRYPTSPSRHIAILGPTASGKSDLAFELALCNPNVELISVDSMCVYRGMDIGTAKPSNATRRLVRYHMLDVADPSEEFSVKRFQSEATTVLREIEARNKVAVLVGGTLLYARALIDNLDIPGRWPEIAQRLESILKKDGGLVKLYEMLQRLDPLSASRIEPSNARRVIRALEVVLGSGRPFSSYGPGLLVHPPTSFLVFGLHRTKQDIHQRVERRLAAQLEEGFLEEVRTLLDRPRGLSRTARQAVGYAELFAYLEQRMNWEEAIGTILKRTKEMVRRQLQWLNRDPRVIWLDTYGSSLSVSGTQTSAQSSVVLNGILGASNASNT